jgi:hypothetical protein
MKKSKRKSKILIRATFPNFNWNEASKHLNFEILTEQNYKAGHKLTINITPSQNVRFTNDPAYEMFDLDTFARRLEKTLAWENLIESNGSKNYIGVDNSSCVISEDSSKFEDLDSDLIENYLRGKTSNQNESFIGSIPSKKNYQKKVYSISGRNSSFMENSHESTVEEISVTIYKFWDNVDYIHHKKCIKEQLEKFYINKKLEANLVVDYEELYHIKVLCSDERKVYFNGVIESEKDSREIEKIIKGEPLTVSIKGLDQTKMDIQKIQESLDESFENWKYNFMENHKFEGDTLKFNIWCKHGREKVNKAINSNLGDFYINASVRRSDFSSEQLWFDNVRIQDLPQESEVYTNPGKWFIPDLIVDLTRFREKFDSLEIPESNKMSLKLLSLYAKLKFIQKFDWYIKDIDEIEDMIKIYQLFVCISKSNDKTKELANIKIERKNSFSMQKYTVYISGEEMKIVNKPPKRFEKILKEMIEEKRKEIIRETKLEEKMFSESFQNQDNSFWIFKIIEDGSEDENERAKIEEYLEAHFGPSNDKWWTITNPENYKRLENIFEEYPTSREVEENLRGDNIMIYSQDKSILIDSYVTSNEKCTDDNPINYQNVDLTIYTSGSISKNKQPNAVKFRFKILRITVPHKEMSNDKSTWASEEEDDEMNCCMRLISNIPCSEIFESADIGIFSLPKFHEILKIWRNVQNQSSYTELSDSAFIDSFPFKKSRMQNLEKVLNDFSSKILGKSNIKVSCNSPWFLLLNGFPKVIDKLMNSKADFSFPRFWKFTGDLLSWRKVKDTDEVWSEIIGRFKKTEQPEIKVFFDKNVSKFKRVQNLMIFLIYSAIKLSKEFHLIEKDILLAPTDKTDDKICLLTDPTELMFEALTCYKREISCGNKSKNRQHLSAANLKEWIGNLGKQKRWTNSVLLCSCLYLKNDHLQKSKYIYPLFISPKYMIKFAKEEA